MNIGVDAHVVSGKFQGSRTYLLNLYRTVLNNETDIDFYFFGDWNTSRDFGNGANYVNYKSDSRIKRLTYQSYSVIRNKHIDFFHSQYIAPLRLPCDSLVTIHDILFESNPEFFSKTQVLRNKLLVRHTVRRAKQIHTVSEFTKKQITEIYNISPEKIKVVPNGVDLSKYNNINYEEARNKIYRKFGIKDYLLSVGRIEPRKNHLGLIKAYKLLKQQLTSVGPLVIVGKKDFGYEDFFSELNDFELNGNIIILDNIDDETLPLLYKSSKLFIYPSFAEGFGIPPLEAMACGVPVISSNTTAIPEVVGHAGILIDPKNIRDLSSAIKRVITDKELDKRLSRQSIQQSKKWSWDNAAKAYIKAISELVSE